MKFFIVKLPSPKTTSGIFPNKKTFGKNYKKWYFSVSSLLLFINHFILKGKKCLN